MNKIYTFNTAPIVGVTRKTFDRMIHLARSAGKMEIEWRNMLEESTDREGTTRICIVGDVHILKQDVAHTTVDVDYEHEQEWLIEKAEEGVDLNKMRVHSHSHVDFGVTPSAEDNKTLGKYIRHLKSGWFVRIIVNKKAEIHCDAIDLKTQQVWYDLPIEVLSTVTTEEAKAIDADRERLVTVKKYKRRENNLQPRQKASPRGKSLVQQLRTSTTTNDLYEKYYGDDVDSLDDDYSLHELHITLDELCRVGWCKVDVEVRVSENPASDLTLFSVTEQKTGEIHLLGFCPVSKGIETISEVCLDYGVHLGIAGGEDTIHRIHHIIQAATTHAASTITGLVLDGNLTKIALIGTQDNPIARFPDITYSEQFDVLFQDLGIPSYFKKLEDDDEQ